VVLAYVGPPWLVMLAGDNGWLRGSHWYTDVAGSLYVLAAVATLGYVASIRPVASISPRSD
jgi:alpha-1,2-mannosyltransferase